MTDVRDNRLRNRFELTEDGQTAIADYRIRDGVMLITHVESPVALRGTGTAGRLMTGALEMARTEGVKVTPLCSYAVAFMRRHKEFEDVRA